MSYAVTDEELNTHFKNALADAEALVKATADLGGEGIAGIRAKAEESRAIVTLIEQAWRETDGGQVSPPRPW